MPFIGRDILRIARHCLANMIYYMESNEAKYKLSVECFMINYCDYDAITHYQPGEFNSKYKTDLTGKLQRIERISYGSQVTDSFQNGSYQTCRTIEPIVLYRVFGQYRSPAKSIPQGARLNRGKRTLENGHSSPRWCGSSPSAARLVRKLDHWLSPLDQQAVKRVSLLFPSKTKRV